MPASNDNSGHLQTLHNMVRTSCFFFGISYFESLKFENCPSITFTVIVRNSICYIASTDKRDDRLDHIVRRALCRAVFGLNSLIVWL